MEASTAYMKKSHKFSIGNSILSAMKKYTGFRTIDRDEKGVLAAAVDEKKPNKTEFQGMEVKNDSMLPRMNFPVQGNVISFDKLKVDGPFC
jgi:hypothetical protein